MDIDLFLYGKSRVLAKFKVVGLIPNPHFQKCRYIVEKLHDCFPTEYHKPEIRAMLNLDWDEYLTKMKRRHGKPYYLLHVPVAVYLDGQFMGGDEELHNHVNKTYYLEPNLDFQELANNELIKYFTNIIEMYQRKFVYLTVAIDEHVVGSMLFMLYNDLVPITCDNFLARCTEPDNGFKGTRIHRIAKYSFIQCGGFKLKDIQMPCENYAVPHNRRGVLSMCNKRRHEENSVQFFITLEPADWLDYNYVAFGQLIQGAEILNMLEKVSTYYESPLNKIEITNCGEFTLCPQMDDEFVKYLNPPYETLFSQDVQLDDIDSVLSITGYKKGKYNLRTDLRAYLPFTRYSRMFDEYLKALEVTAAPMEEQESEEEQEQPKEEEIESTSSSLEMQMKSLFLNSDTFYFRGDHVII